MRYVALAGACVFAGAGHADELESPTLRKIRDTGTIVIGVREATVPFSYMAGGEHATGYSYEITQRIVDNVRETLKLPELRVRELVVTPQNRITLVQNGTIDLECSTTTHTRERENDVAFSNSIFEYGVRMLVKRGSPVKDFGDLAGRTVVTTAGTSEERLLRRWNMERAMNMRIVVAKMERSGEALALYRRWFESPIPPAGVNLDYPMSEPMKALFAHPNDHPLD
ncbi:transporter substrate-binding domain-containing protein [Paraburkholderia sp. EG286B]|uniref:transporter substrate-binding domain-containing protein n=1 Tax=Paraburkholderia sp. EG286B TaxID=3237011 RepID=UPI0034D2E9A6